jgi:hypothetical protein
VETKFAEILVGDPELVNEIREALDAAGFFVIRSAASRCSHQLPRNMLRRDLVWKPPTQPDRTRCKQPQTRRLSSVHATRRL